MKLVFSDEASFELHGNINRQNIEASKIEN